MTYVGSKRRIAKDILPIILAARVDGQSYVEPFVGGANILAKVSGFRLANDKCPYLVAYLKHLAEDGAFTCEPITEEMYKDIRDNKSSYPEWLVGFAGYCLSFSAKFFGGYARGWKIKGVSRRNYQDEAVRNGQAQQESLRGVKFSCGDYRDMVIPANSLIYCDPPYKGTLGYGSSGFDHEAFYGWCREKQSEGHTVFVSELDMPGEFTCVWKKTIVNSVNRKDFTRVMSEKLFTLKF